MTHDLLEELKRETKIPVTSSRLAPEKRWEALGWLCRLPCKERFPLKDWEETVSCLLGCQVWFGGYDEVEKSLKPFSLTIH